LEEPSGESVPTRRYHNLDLYRGVLMVLGVWIHTAIVYLGGPFTDQSQLAADVVFKPLVYFIHLFRMPAFFVLSGFFGAMLWARRGPRALLGHRLKRIGLPIVVFLPLVWQLLKLQEYAGHALSGGTMSMSDALAVALGRLPELPTDTVHLWFIYQLLWIHLGVMVLTWCAERQPTVSAWLHRVGRRLVASPLQMAGGLVALHLLWRIGLGWVSIPTSNDFVPDPTILAYYTGWFGLGWVLWRLDLAPESIVGSAAQRRWVGAVTIAAISTRFACQLIFGDDFDELDWQADGATLAISLLVTACNSLATCGLAWLSAVLFLKRPDKHRPAGRYLSDASYWVYVMHLPFAVSVPHLFWWPSAPPLLHFLLTSSLVFLFCLVTYDALVRNGWIGVLLNGRRVPPVAPWLGRGMTAGLLLLAVFMIVQMPKSTMSGWRAEDPSTLLDIPSTFPHSAASGEDAGPACLRVESLLICTAFVPSDGVTEACAALSARGDQPWSAEQQALLIDVLPRVTSRAVWVPVHADRETGDWSWNNGTAVDALGFAPGQPDGRSKDPFCAGMNWQDKQGWVDLPCSGFQGFVCTLPESGR
jgi:hypothetical protein